MQLETQLTNPQDSHLGPLLPTERGPYTLNGMRPPTQSVCALPVDIIIAATDVLTQTPQTKTIKPSFAHTKKNQAANPAPRVEHPMYLRTIVNSYTTGLAILNSAVIKTVFVSCIIV